MKPYYELCVDKCMKLIGLIALKILIRAYSFDINNNTRGFIFHESSIYLPIKMNKFLLELHLASSGS